MQSTNNNAKKNWYQKRKYIIPIISGLVLTLIAFFLSKFYGTPSENSSQSKVIINNISTINKSGNTTFVFSPRNHLEQKGPRVPLEKDNTISAKTNNKKEIKGKVFSQISNMPIENATIFCNDEEIGKTDKFGRFKGILENTPQSKNVKVQAFFENKSPWLNFDTLDLANIQFPVK